MDQIFYSGKVVSIDRDGKSIEIELDEHSYNKFLPPNVSRDDNNTNIVCLEFNEVDTFEIGDEIDWTVDVNCIEIDMENLPKNLTYHDKILIELYKSIKETGV